MSDHDTIPPEMKNRFAAPVASAATGLLLLGGCSDDGGPATLAKGDDVELVGTDDLGGQTLDIDAEEQDGEVTGELRFTDASGEIVVTVECADAGTDGLVILGGSVAEADEAFAHVALLIREGDPDSVAIWTEMTSESCAGLLEAARENVLTDDSAFVDVESGDIATG